MTVKERKVIYSAEIGLTSGETIEEEDMTGPVEEIILHRLPADMEKIFGIEVKTRILATQHSSLIIFFEAVFTGFSLIANYKNFHDSALLLKRHFERLIKSLSEQRFDKRLYSIIRFEYPYFSEHEHGISLSREDRYFSDEFPGLITLPTQRRDGFFYFLLVLSIVSLTIIGLLVYGAVVKTYFP